MVHSFWVHPLSWRIPGQSWVPDPRNVFSHPNHLFETFSNIYHESDSAIQTCSWPRRLAGSLLWESAAPLPHGDGNLNVHCAAAPRAGIGLAEWEQGRRHQDRRVWTALLPRSLPFRFPKSPVPVDSIMRRDLFVEGSFQLYCLTQRWEGGRGKMRIILRWLLEPSKFKLCLKLPCNSSQEGFKDKDPEVILSL